MGEWCDFRTYKRDIKKIRSTSLLQRMDLTWFENTYTHVMSSYFYSAEKSQIFSLDKNKRWKRKNTSFDVELFCNSARIPSHFLLLHLVAYSFEKEREKRIIFFCLRISFEWNRIAVAKWTNRNGHCNFRSFVERCRLLWHCCNGIDFSLHLTNLSQHFPHASIQAISSSSTIGLETVGTCCHSAKYCSHKHRWIARLLILSLVWLWYIYFDKNDYNTIETMFAADITDYKAKSFE